MATAASLILPIPLANKRLDGAEALPSASGPMAMASDTDLIARVTGGDTDAFGVLYARHSAAVFGVLVRLCGQRALAEEWLQETFTRVWLAARTHDPGRGPVKAWIFKIALNTARRDLSRKRHRVTHVSIDAGGVDLADDRVGRVCDRLDDERRASDVRAALERLPDFMREVVVLRCSRELSFAEISAVTGAPQGTLKSRFHRAVLTLRDVLAVRGGRR